MKTVLKYVLIYFGLSIVGAILLMFPALIIEIALNHGDISAETLGTNTWSLVIMMLGSQLLPLYVFWKHKWCDYSFIKDPDAYSFLLWAAVGWVGFVIIATFIQTYVPQFEWDLEFLKDIGEMSKNPLGIISVCVLAPLLEEGIFRGTIERKLLEKKDRSPWFAIVLSALAFAIVHMNLIQGIIALTLGIFMGWIYYRTRNIWYCIFVHALNNTVSTVAFLLTNDETGASPYSPPVNLVLLLVGIVVIYVFAQQYKKLPLTVPQEPVVMGQPLPMEEPATMGEPLVQDQPTSMDQPEIME